LFNISVFDFALSDSDIIPDTRLLTPCPQSTLKKLSPAKEPIRAVENRVWDYLQLGLAVDNRVDLGKDL
jgi:hypothetical protein